jgi:hypothetical protein
VKGNFRTHISRNDPLRGKLANARGKRDQSLNDIAAAERFGIEDARVKQVRKALVKQEKQVAKLEAAFVDVENNKIYDGAFEWRFEFPAVLDEAGTFVGFDVVVGNPPYVRQEELAAVKPYLKDNYEVYAGTADLLVYFIELAMKNLRPNGQFSFIIANKFIRAGFGKALRKYIPQYRVHELLDFGDLPVFEEATTYPLIISLEKTEPTGEFKAANIEELHPKDFRASLEEVSFTSLQSGLTEDGWNLANVQTQRLLDKLKNTGVPLGEYVNGEIYYGIKTGFNEAFVIDAETKDRLIKEDPKSAEVIKPFLAGRDVKRYVPPVAEKYLILFKKGWTKTTYGSLGENEAFDNFSADYPAVAGWLSEFKVKAKKRSDQGDYWWELRACDYYDSFNKPKIMYQVFQVKPVFIFDEGGIFCNNSMWIIPDSNYTVLGILNSSLGWWQISMFCTAIQNGFQLINKYLEKVRVIKREDKVESLVTRILAIKQTDPTADTSALEAEIDVLVYRLYGLSWGEVRVVDPDFGLSEEAYWAVSV